MELSHYSESNLGASYSPLVIASHNEGKVNEIRALLLPLGITVISAAALGLPEPEETGATFAENARIKSENAALFSGHYALADDSGLCVEALGGEPGIYSARWAGKEKSFALASNLIQHKLEEKNITPNGAASHFVCVLSLTSPAGESETFEGIIHGALSFPPKGDKGFGYDPIFTPAGYDVTFAQMEAEAKHAISHRARAFEKFLAYAREHNPKNSFSAA